MQLRASFEAGMTPEEYADLLDEKQRRLHEHHERRVEIDPEVLDRLRAAGTIRVLVITEPWCGDSLAAFPAIAELCRRACIELRVVRRDDHPELIDRYLTKGGRAIPIAIVLDRDFEELFHWGPRPGPAQAIFEEHRAAVAAGTVERGTVHKKIRAFYARDRGKTIVEELLAAFDVVASRSRSGRPITRQKPSASVPRDAR